MKRNANKGGRPPTWIGGGGLDARKLANLGVAQLRLLFLEVFGQPTASNNSAWLRQKLSQPAPAPEQIDARSAGPAKPVSPRMPELLAEAHSPDHARIREVQQGAARTIRCHITEAGVPSPDTANRCMQGTSQRMWKSAEPPQASASGDYARSSNSSSSTAMVHSLCAQTSADQQQQRQPQPCKTQHQQHHNHHDDLFCKLEELSGEARRAKLLRLNRCLVHSLSSDLAGQHVWLLQEGGSSKSAKVLQVDVPGCQLWLQYRGGSRGKGSRASRGPAVVDHLHGAGLQHVLASGLLATKRSSPASSSEAAAGPVARPGSRQAGVRRPRAALQRPDHMPAQAATGSAAAAAAGSMDMHCDMMPSAGYGVAWRQSKARCLEPLVAAGGDVSSGGRRRGPSAEEDVRPPQLLQQQQRSQLLQQGAHSQQQWQAEEWLQEGWQEQQGRGAAGQTSQPWPQQQHLEVCYDQQGPAQLQQHARRQSSWQQPAHAPTSRQQELLLHQEQQPPQQRVQQVQQHQHHLHHHHHHPCQLLLQAAQPANTPGDQHLLLQLRQQWQEHTTTPAAAATWSPRATQPAQQLQVRAHMPSCGSGQQECGGWEHLDPLMAQRAQPGSASSNAGGLSFQSARSDQPLQHHQRQRLHKPPLPQQRSPQQQCAEAMAAALPQQPLQQQYQGQQPLWPQGAAAGALPDACSGSLLGTGHWALDMAAQDELYLALAMGSLGEALPTPDAEDWPFAEGPCTAAAANGACTAGTAADLLSALQQHEGQQQVQVQVQEQEHTASYWAAALDYDDEDAFLHGLSGPWDDE